ncbi:Spy0128 family protein [Streptococcus parasanguinis]|uniref:Spy0128 family protein n=1 Tax=Streptococcus parasanguinis TaxID=1318 RepID=UPI00066D6FCD|nr:FctA domain-containing protein [Streptococcus parasanguinis]MBS6743074.1 pilin isopeptide linkage protein [Streptococcus parasanguinis]
MKKPILVVFSLLAALLFLFVAGSKVTQAKELTTQVKITQAKLDGDQISYHWEIGTGVEIGDTFKISMPEDVKFASSAFNSMKNEKGEEIATGKVSDDGKTLTITFVKGGNKGAEGNVSFYYKWDKDNTTGKDQERTIKIGTESVIVKRSGQGPVPLLLPIKKYNSGATDNTNLQHAQKIWGPTGIPDWRDTLTVTDEQADGFLTWHISVNNAVDKQAPASSIVFTDQMPNLPALDLSRIKSAKGQDVAQYFKGGTYLPASFDLRVNGKTFVANGVPMAGLGLEPYIEWTEHGFKLDLTKISDQFKNASTDEITLSYQTLLQHADQIKSVTNVASLKSDQHPESVSKENTWVNKAASADAKVFNSEPTISPVSANLVVKKAFEVAGDQKHTQLPITEGQFEFALKDENNKVVETAKNKADGSVNFKSLTFNKEGTHTYTITENKGTDASVNYSTQSIKATVDVKKDNDKLVATVTYSGGDGEQKNTITNTQNKPKVSNAKVTLNLKKEFEGGELKGDDFEFVAKDSNDKVVATAKNQKNGSITFDNITVDKAGTFKYTITETKGTDKTITYSDKTITATVVVVEKDNALVVEQISYSDGQTDTDTFTNKKEAPKTESVTATLQVNKLLKEGETNLPLTDDQFEFVLKEGNNTLETAKNKANGTVTFKELSYTAEGTHTYTITENKGTDASINYSTQTITATVEVKKVNDKLVATVTYSGGDAEKGDTFTNTKTPPTPVPPTVKPTTAKFKAKKVLAINGSSDRTLKANEFTFLLKDQNGTLVDTKTNGENGDILFNPVRFNEAGTFTYTIVEQKPATPESAITYDESVHTVTVTVTKDANGQLNADVQYDGKKDIPTFTNTYTPPTPPTPSEKQITTSKILEGRDLQGGEFSFNLLDENGTVLQTKQNAADGTVTFDAIAYTEAMIGTHKYTVKEVVPADQANIQYDEGQVDVTVTVTKDEASNAIQAVVSYGDKKTFINKVIPPTPPTIDIPELKLYTLKVRKVDEKGNYLAGAVFGLFEADGVTPVANPYGQGQAQAISGQDGLASFVGFEAKEYIIKELSAPSGYQLSDTAIKVSASDFASATNLVVDKGNVVNKLLPPPPSTDIPNIPTPSNSKPKTPSPNGDKPKPSDKPKSSETPKSSDKPKEGKRSLPSTGTADHLGLLVTGLTFVATAIASLTLKKKEDF